MGLVADQIVAFTVEPVGGSGVGKRSPVVIENGWATERLGGLRGGSATIKTVWAHLGHFRVWPSNSSFAFSVL